MRRAKFSLSHTKLFSCDMGELIPAACFEVLPGDVIQHTTSALVRAAALLAPVMHPVHVRFHHWYVPTRLIWQDFTDFITGGPDGLNASVYPTVTIPGGGFAAGSLADYLGVPPSVGATQSVSALPFRAYQLIYKFKYRDQDLETSPTINTASGADATTTLTLQNCDWEKDFFTSARPWEQKGAAVTIPIGGTAPVSFTNQAIPVRANNVNPMMTANAAIGGTNARGLEVSPGGSDPGGNLPLNVQASLITTGTANLAAATAQSIIALRQAFGLQRFQEARARFGSRYEDLLRFWGVRPDDARLQEPEYLGGGRDTIQFSEVLQTGVTTSGSSAGVGTMRGHGISANRTNRYRRFIPEHGFVLTLMSVKPKSMYSQGLRKMWNRRTKEDFWNPEFQHIGQQAIKNKELYLQHATPEGTFGYQDRYDEYRREESSVAGEFRNSTLNFWHMARDFAADPALNASFVKCVPTERTFAVPSEDVLYVYAKHSIQARRLVAQMGKSFIY